jgi:hypothetical protein
MVARRLLSLRSLPGQGRTDPFNPRAALSGRRNR